MLSGLVGGVAAVVIGAVLLATGVVDAGGDQAIVAQQPITQPASDEGGNEFTVNDIYEQASPGVVFIESEGVASESPLGLPPGGEGEGNATGSGFVLDRDGFVLTNAHVVDGASDVTVRFGEDDLAPAEVIGADLSSDIAVLKLDPGDVDDLEPLPLGDSKQIKVGDPAIAIGNPFGFDRTITTGIVSAVQRQIEAPNGFSIDDVIQTDASINPGNSGGPLLDGAGRVIGINSQIATGGSSGSVGIGFAVPVETAKNVIPQLKEDGEVERAFLGVTTAPVDEQLAADEDLPADAGALVQDVTPDGPAADAGLEAGDSETAEGLVLGGDLIVGVDGTEITNPNDVAAAIADNQPGDTVDLEIFRGSERQSIEVELGERPARAQPAPAAPGDDGGGGSEEPDDSLPFPLP